ncbi:MAG: cell division transport system permease protein [Oceanicoccus sp.]|jgi:cell division transport system permease protein
MHLAGQSLNRNLYMSITTTVMMGLILFIFNVIWSLNVLTHASLQDLESKVDLIVYLDDSTSLYDITDMKNSLEGLEEIVEVDYTSKEEALQNFLGQYPEKEALFTSYGLENPLPANFRIVTESPENHTFIIEYLDESPYGAYLLEIESANENQEIVERLVKVRDFTQTLVIGVILAFVMGSLFMIMNAIHLSIFTRKKEIQIMQLVGAHPSMIRFPFLFEGALYSLLSVLFSFALLFFFIYGTKLNTFISFSENFHPLTILGVELIVSLIIGVLSSLLAINFYLKRTFALES